MAKKKGEEEEEETEQEEEEEEEQEEEQQPNALHSLNHHIILSTYLCQEHASPDLLITASASLTVCVLFAHTRRFLHYISTSPTSRTYLL